MKPDPAATADSPLPLEALEFESPSAVIVATRVPPLSRAINFLVFLLVVATLAAAGLIQIDKIVSGRGKLVAEAPNIVLQPFDQSIVESIDVRKGDIVRAGQVLARLNPTFSAADLTAMKDQVDSLSAIAARLEAEIAGSSYPPGAAEPPDGADPLVAHEASTFALGAAALDRLSSGTSFSLAVVGFDILTFSTVEAFDWVEQADSATSEVADPLVALRASESDDPSAGGFFSAAAAHAAPAIESDLTDRSDPAARSADVWRPVPGGLRSALLAMENGSADAPSPSFKIASVSMPARVARATSGPIETAALETNPYVELQASIFNQRTREYTSALERYDQTVNQLRLQIAGSEAQAKFYHERASIAGRVEDLRQTLVEREAGSVLNRLIATDTRLNIEGLYSQSESDAAQAGRQLAAQAAERESFIQRWAVQNLRDLAETRRNLVQAEQEYAKANLYNELIVLTAPRDSVVLSVATVSPGSVVTSAEPLIHLVPMDVPLSVEVDIAGIDSGYVRPGDEVTIKFDTLPYLQYGMARGVVSSISADSFNPEAMVQDDGASLPTRPSTLYYKGDIAIDKLELHDTPPGFRLMPGMPVTADVKVGTRSILAYFVARILPVAYESIREP